MPRVRSIPTSSPTSRRNGITPGAQHHDWEFVRRVTLDLTGRIPTPDRVLTFVADTAPDKRAKLIDELLAKPEWVDKWTMYFGDLYQNTRQQAEHLAEPLPAGRNAFYSGSTIRSAADKPYNQMATRADRAPPATTATPTGRELPGGRLVTGGPSQDIMDQMTANVVRRPSSASARELRALPQRPRPPGP